jgi:hypothetical protein
VHLFHRSIIPICNKTLANNIPFVSDSSSLGDSQSSRSLKPFSPTLFTFYRPNTTPNSTPYTSSRHSAHHSQNNNRSTDSDTYYTLSHSCPSLPQYLSPNSPCSSPRTCPDTPFSDSRSCLCSPGARSRGGTKSKIWNQRRCRV